ncbi:hypothetical protein BDQ12DRAFT_760721 [Crucibulum laeve]|uniref:Uncharacterized protein n=1 Tax=Crucibulum laeve TaxID=68775 RepID=A0A5C3LGN5_9AGAR|nr:hypothetical protein BDQ12DRAFT_760721 [Crucibulum laeve]
MSAPGGDNTLSRVDVVYAPPIPLIPNLHHRRMLFHASIDNLPTLYRIIQAIEKLKKKKCTTKFSKDTIRSRDANEGGIQVQLQTRITSIFTDYRVQSRANNEITLCLSSEALLAAL